MSEFNFICPKTNESCPRPGSCSIINEPLKGIIYALRKEYNGQSSVVVNTTLERNIQALTPPGYTLYYKSEYRKGNASICPIDLINAPDYGINLGKPETGLIVRYIAQQGINNTKVELEWRQNRIE